MGCKALDFLGGLFGGAPVVSQSVAGPEPLTPAAAPASAEPDQGDGGGAQGKLFPEPADPLAGWVDRPDASGRLGLEAPDLPEEDRWWAHPELVVEPGLPCPKCGSLEKWWGLAGGEHCRRCESEKLARALRLAEKAARLRGAALQDSRGGVPTGRVDIQDRRWQAALYGPSRGLGGTGGRNPMPALKRKPEDSS